jgi:Protein of unknown function (DUF1566)
MKYSKILHYTLVIIWGLVLLVTVSCSKKEADPVPLSIGQTYMGGIIFYLDETKKHGLVCAPTDQSTALPWWNGSHVVTGAFGSDIGTGRLNTETIVAVQGTGNYAARICNDLVLGGFSDWYLPSKSECFSMYFNLKIMKNMGGFGEPPNALYWSSTESSYNLAYSQYSNDGYGPTGGYYKNSAYYVRAVRAF